MTRGSFCLTLKNVVFDLTFFRVRHLPKAFAPSTHTLRTVCPSFSLKYFWKQLCPVMQMKFPFKYKNYLN